MTDEIRKHCDSIARRVASNAPREERIPFIGTVDAEVVGANYNDANDDIRSVNEALANYERVKAERDELLAALRDIKNAAASPYQVAEIDRLTGHSANLEKFSGRVYSVARATIAKASGGAQ